MTYYGPHERAVVQGDDVCTCGRDWPCERSAEGRLTALRSAVEALAAKWEADAREMWAQVRESDARAGSRVAAGMRAVDASALTDRAAELRAAIERALAGEDGSDRA